MVGIKDRDLELLFALIKGSKRSDRELAKAIGCSQPTVTRIRSRLEKEGLIEEYTIVPDLRKMGYELVAFTFLSFAEDRPELFVRAREWCQKQSSLVFAVDGEGMGMNSVMVSIHRDYGSYTRLITQLRRDWQPNLRDEQSFIVSLDRPDLFTKHFSFRYLQENE